MAIKREGLAVQMAFWGVVLAAACTTSARAQDKGKEPRKPNAGKQASAAVPDRMTAVIQRARPAIVEVLVDLRTGHAGASGVVVDAAKGLVATNFHVVGGATKCVVVFPSDRDGKQYPVDGFVAALPGRDLAILHVRTGDKKLTALELAPSLPKPGEAVYAVGALFWWSCSNVSDGTLTAIRTGQELAEFWDGKEGKGFFKTIFRYDMDCLWVQHDAAVRHGWGGGPLLNAKGEVLGLNTLVFDPTGDGPMVSFAISAKHLRQALAAADKAVQPLSKLPPFFRETIGCSSSPEKTLAAWTALNRGMYEFNNRIAEAEKRLETIPKPDPRNPMRGRIVRVKKLQSVMKSYGNACCDFATKIKQIDLKQVHHQLANWLLTEAVVLDHAGKSYKEIASSISMDNPPAENDAEAKAKVEGFQDILEQLHDRYDRLRVKLGEMYETEFPTVEQTAEEDQRPSKDQKMAKVADEKPDAVAAVIKKALAAIVEIRTDHSLGSGVVVDAAKGLVATNLHVVGGATKCVVALLSDRYGKQYPVDGFVAALPGRDLAILHVRAGDRKLAALELAPSLPKQGEVVYAMSTSSCTGVSDGIVTAIRTGQELADLWDRREGKGFFKTVFRYEMDCTWIQHDSPISHGDSGGPLLNAKGEVLGLNTLAFNPTGEGQTLPFAISAKHLRQALAAADKAVQPLSKLPPFLPEPMCCACDLVKTLTAWTAFNRAFGDFKGKLAAAEKNLEAVHKVAAGAPARSLKERSDQAAAAYRQFGFAYSAVAGKIKAIDLKRTDRQLANWLAAEAAVLDRAGRSYNELASSISGNAASGEQYAEVKLAADKEILKQLEKQYAELRDKLGETFDTEFPTVEQTAEEHQRPARPQRANVPDALGYRIWTSANGKYQLDAKLLDVTEDGQKVRLKRRSGGKELLVPIRALCKEDQKYIADAAADEEAGPPEPKKAPLPASR